MNSLSIHISGTEFLLHPLRAIYWPAQKTLICSDVHIGKAEHFRKSGIEMPRLVNKNNFWNLSVLFELYKPERWLVLGDLMHSTVNSEWYDLTDFLANYPSIHVHLIRGNHELYPDQTYLDLGFEVSESLISGDLLFTHEEESRSQNLFNIHGHIHPAVRLRGAAGQSLRLPCFYKSETKFILPAFGAFTGSFTVKPKRTDRVFVIAENKVMEISPAVNT